MITDSAVQAHFLVIEEYLRTWRLNLPNEEAKSAYFNFEKELEGFMRGIPPSFLAANDTNLLIYNPTKMESLYPLLGFIFKLLRNFGKMEYFDNDACFCSLPPTLRDLLLDYGLVLESNFGKSDDALIPKEIIEYVNIGNPTEFEQIPVEFLDSGDGVDFGLVFGRRWIRRNVAKCTAYSLLFNGRLAQQVHINLEESKLLSFLNEIDEPSRFCVDIRLPEDLDSNLLHLHASFESSQITSEFTDAMSFQACLCRILEALPEKFPRSLSNIDIFSWIPYKNASATTGHGEQILFDALLLALGLKGHLKPAAVLPVDIHEILNFDSISTSASLLLGLACTWYKCPTNLTIEDAFVTREFLSKLLALHLPTLAMSDVSTAPPAKLQIISYLGLGLLHCGQAPRGLCQMLARYLSERMPDNVNNGAKETALQSTFASLSLGMMLFGGLASKDPNVSRFSSDIFSELDINVAENRLTALIASSFIGFGSGRFINLHWSRNWNDMLKRPDPILFWSILALRLSRWNDPINLDLDYQGEDADRIDFEAVLTSITLPDMDEEDAAAALPWIDSSELALFSYVCTVLWANSYFVMLKLMGTRNQQALDALDHWIHIVRNHPSLRSHHIEYFAQRLQNCLLRAYLGMLLARASILNGTHDAATWSLLREFYAEPLQFSYGLSRVFHMALGLLFVKKPIRFECNRDVMIWILSALPMHLASLDEAELNALQYCESLWQLLV